MVVRSFYEILEDQLRSELRAEIESELRTQLSAELSTEWRAEHSAEGRTAASKTSLPHEQLESWLLQNVGIHPIAQRKKSSQAYGMSSIRKSKPDAAIELPDRFASRRVETHQAESAAATKAPAARLLSTLHFKLTTEDQFAIELLERESGCALGAELTVASLKRAWRQAALKSHPDRFAECSDALKCEKAALFRLLADSYHRLEALFVDVA